MALPEAPPVAGRAGVDREAAPRPIRVLFMQSQEFFGADSMVHSLLMRHYDRAKVEVHVACAPGGRGSPSPSLAALRPIPGIRLRPTRFGPTLHRVSTRRLLADLPSAAPALLSLAGLAAYARHHRIDVVHGTEKPRDAFYGVLLGKVTGARSIVHVHVKCEGWMSPLVRWAMGQADGIVAISDFVGRSAVAMGYRPERVHVLRNGLEASAWDPATDGSTVRQELGIPAGVPVLAIVSRMFHWKGHLLLVEALAKVRDAVPDFRLLVVGADDARGAPDRGSLTAEIREQVGRLRLSEQVMFTGWRTDVERVLAACDVYAMPSFEEPLGVIYLEAMAMGKPVVALRSGGVPEVVEHGGSGLLSEPGDADGLAEHIVTLLRDPGLRARMGRRGRELVETANTPARMADEGLRIYRSLLS
jgi:glycosyltransferase involved in cell wall biosynthesis